jgi:ADP-heptose:LPS heptosyltransferase
LFGNLRLPFRAERVLISRSWRLFRAGHLNETIFNLETAQALLGIPYGREDATHYFAGELAWSPRAAPVVGFHAGSKAGRWLCKRWPHFAELAERLTARGLAVASFGTPDEYVEGSENRTGGSIEEMSRAMLDCSVFVSNDSGPMHIASAMGMPTLALYAPTDPLTHLPLAPNVTALALEKSCAPCEVKDHAHFATGACRCVGEISVAAVEQKVLQLLRCPAEEADVSSDAHP